MASAFFRLGDLRRAGVRFRTGLHASEDALFVAEYLLGLPSPRLGLVAGASYIYRRRASRDSAVDAFRTDQRAYFERFEAGYEPLMRSCGESGVPELARAGSRPSGELGSSKRGTACGPRCTFLELSLFCAAQSSSLIPFLKKVLVPMKERSASSEIRFLPIFMSLRVRRA